MKSRSDKTLLDDVLSEAGPPNFQEALLTETLRLAQRRRNMRRLWQASPALLLGVLAFFFFSHHSVIEKTSHPTVEMVATQPLNPAAIIRTTPLAETNRVSSMPGVLIVHTQPGGGNFRLIGDEELLALAAPRSAVLIRLCSDSQALIFANPKETTIKRQN